MDYQIIIIIALMILTAAMLIAGIITMAKGGEFNQKHGNKFMGLRVFFQTITIILLAVLFFMDK